MQKGCRHQLREAKWTDCWDLNIHLESDQINLSVLIRTKATAVYFGLSKKWRGTEKVNMLKRSHEFLYNLWTIKSDIFLFLIFKESISVPHISVCKSPKKWSIKMMHLYKDDHIKYGPLAEDHATLGWSADGWVPLQPWDHLDILHLSQRPVHSGTKQGSFVLPFLLAVLLWSWQIHPKKQKPPLMDKAQKEDKI